MISKMWERFKHKRLEFWAERGMVNIIDYRKSPPEYKSEMLREFLMRAQNFVDERKRIAHRAAVSTSTTGRRIAHEQIEELQKLIDDMVRCARIAKHQGDPSDPRVQEHIRKHGDSSRKIFVPTAADVAEVNRPVPLSAMQPARRSGRFATTESYTDYLKVK